MHIIWLIGTEHFNYAQDKISSMKHFLAICIIVLIVKKSFVVKIIGAFVLSMLFSEICSYLIFFGIIEPFNNATKINPVPFMLNHGFYATFLALSLGVLLYGVFKKKYHTSCTTKVIGVIFITTITFNILIISSRLGYILLISVILTMVYIFFKKNIIKSFFISLSILFVLYLTAYTNIQNFQKRVNQAIEHIEKIATKNDYTTSEGIRFGFHVYSIKGMKDNIFFGLGTGDHIEHIKSIIKEANKKSYRPMINILSQGTGSSLHSDYLDIYVQFGLVGLIIFLNIFYQLYKYNQKDPDLKSLQVLLIVVVLISAIPQGMIYFSPLNKLFILLLGVTLRLYQDEKNSV